jgi:hypothetical protein
MGINLLCLKNHSFPYRMLLWSIIAFGILLRASQYLFNRSLWLDEACLVWNIVHKPFSELLGPLHYNQAAPIGFLFVEKFFVQEFGNTEYILRLFPLMCGILSLPLYYQLVKHHISKGATLFAVALLSLSNTLIYYASDVKQYASDVMIVIILYLAVFYFEAKKMTPHRIASFGLLGAAAIWFSHPSLFILAGFGITLTASNLLRRDFSRLIRLALVFSVWAVSFACIYIVSYDQVTRNEGLLRYWNSAFMPFPPTGMSELLWFPNKLLEILKNPAQIAFPKIAVILLLVGCISMLFKRKKVFFFLFSPIIFALLASALHLYPFEGRLLLFTLPALFISVALGAQILSLKSNTIMAIFLLLFLYPPFSGAYRQIENPRVREEIKPVMHYIQQHWQKGDVLYCAHKTKPAFEYYSSAYGFQGKEVIISPFSNYDPAKFAEDLEQLEGRRRVWLLFTHIHPHHKKQIKKYLKNSGGLKKSFSSPGATVFLYRVEPKSSEFMP